MVLAVYYNALIESKGRYMFSQLLNKFFPSKEKNKLFPQFLASTPIDESIKPLNEYRDFIGRIRRWEDCTALLGAAEGINHHVNISIKDWIYTARAHHSDFIKKVIVQKCLELQEQSSCQQLHIKMTP